MSCVEHLCDTLCYHLDLASFVACVNSGQPWNSKFSLLLSGKEQVAFRDEDTYSDPFVENFVLERLSVQTSIRVMLYVCGVVVTEELGIHSHLWKHYNCLSIAIYLIN